MKTRTLGLFAGLATLAAPGVAHAAVTAIATSNVNLRAGPSTQYPAVNVVRNGDEVYIFGCLQTRSWCDVSYAGQRGWISSRYLAYFDDGRRYVGSDVIEFSEAPIISFSFGSYWDDHYRGRAFYRDRDHWDRWDRAPRRRYRDEGLPPPPPPFPDALPPPPGAFLPPPLPR